MQIVQEDSFYPFREGVPVLSRNLPRLGTRLPFIFHSSNCALTGLVPGWERLPFFFFLFYLCQRRRDLHFTLSSNADCTVPDTHTHTHPEGECTHKHTHVNIYILEQMCLTTNITDTKIICSSFAG